MEGIDAIFSSDETFFEEAAMLGNENHRFDSEHRRDRDNNREFDPPSKVCGGAVFSKLMAIGSASGSSKNHNKIFHGNSTGNGSSPDKKHKKKNRQQQQQQQQQQHHKHWLQLQLQQHPKQQQQLQKDERSSKLIAKLTNKIMKRRKETGTERTKNNSYKPAIVMPTATTMSSLSEPSVSSSPWATDDNDFFHHPTHPTNGFFNGEMNIGGLAIMGEITGKHINRLQQQKQQPIPPSPRRTNASLRDLQSLLKEMNNLNGMVRDNSTILQAGIENIALELQHQTKEGGKQSPPPPNPPLKAGRNNEDEDENWGENHNVKNREGGNRRSIVDIGIGIGAGRGGDNEEIEKLKQERIYYRSETETLRLEMECIKEQLSELRKHLKKSSNDENHPDSHQQQQQQSQQQLPTDDGNSVDFRQSNHAYAASTTTTTTSISSSSSSSSSTKTGAVDDSDSTSRRHLRNQQYLKTIENPHSSDAKVSFRSEIREILSASERSTRSVLERMSVQSAEADYHQQQLPNQTIDIQQFPSTQKEHSGVAQSNGGAAHRIDFAIAKSFYKKQWGNTMPSGKKEFGESLTDDDSSSRGIIAAAAAAKTQKEFSFVTEDQIYRVPPRSFKHDFSPQHSIPYYNNDDDGGAVESLPQQQQNPGAEDSEDEYLKELRISWYEKRGLVTDAN